MDEKVGEGVPSISIRRLSAVTASSNTWGALVQPGPTRLTFLLIRDLWRQQRPPAQEFFNDFEMRLLRKGSVGGSLDREYQK
jgi:hypothetical protein